MAEAYQRPVARIRRADGGVAGAGFLAPRGFVVTCAHVVNDALGRAKLATARPEEPVRLDLPWAGGDQFIGRVIEWRAPIVAATRQGEACVDIAVLQLDHTPPDDCAVAPQAPAGIAEGTMFRVMGFPDGADAGAPAKASVRGTDAGGWHHVEADQG